MNNAIRILNKVKEIKKKQSQRNIQILNNTYLTLKHETYHVHIPSTGFLNSNIHCIMILHAANTANKVKPTKILPFGCII